MSDLDEMVADFVAEDREAAQAQARFLGALIASPNSGLTPGQAAAAMRGRTALVRELAK